MSEDPGTDYWSVRCDTMLVQLDNRFVHFKPAIAEVYGKSEADEIAQDIHREFGRLIPDLPYVGEDNPNTHSLVDSALLLAFFRSLKKRGAGPEQAAEIFFKGYRKYLHSTLFILRWAEKKMIVRPQRLEKLISAARESQERKYPGDYVFEVSVDENPPNVIHTYVSECGAKKFLMSQDALDLLPYVCHTDYVLYGALGIEFRCISSIAYGHEKCHYRVTLNRKPLPDWPLIPPEMGDLRETS
jgi:hypothetical protein